MDVKTMTDEQLIAFLQSFQTKAVRGARYTLADLQNMVAARMEAESRNLTW